MSLIGSEILAGASGSGVSAYEIEQSLRFDGNSYLSWDDNVTPDIAARDLWTLSVWIKRGTLSNAQQGIFSAYQNANNRQRITFQSDDTLQSEERGGGASKEESTTNELFRDPSAWYHLTFLYDVNAPGGSGDYVQFWINGVRSNETNAARVDDWAGVVGDSGTTHNIGRVLVSTPTSYFNGYLAEFHLCPGQRKAPTDFGEYDESGVWRPIEYTGSYGTHGYYLKFDPSATNGIGHDHSGNGNHFTASGISTSGTGTDVMSDTPTTNWCTLNPLYSPATSSNIPRNGNLEVVSSATGYDQVHIATHAFTSGKWYWEYRLEGSSAAGGAGIIDPTTTAFHDMMRSTSPSLNLTGGFQRRQNGTVSSAGVSNVSSGSISNGTVAMFAVDYDSGKVWVGTGGTWYNSGDPAAGTNPTITIQTLTTAVPFFSPTDSGSQTYHANWGQRAFEYTQPSGFKALNTSNLPAPEIADGSDYFQTVLWTGNGNQTRSLTVADNSGNTWQPDFTWMKSRSVNQEHQLYDAVRGAGAGKMLCSNQTAQEGQDGSGNSDSQYGYISSFDTDGFSLNDGTVATTGGWVNYSGRTYVAWNWLAGGTGSSNTAGSRTSTVSVNPSAGFSIVNFTGTGSALTVGHGLGVAPDLMIAKNRDKADNWVVWHNTFNMDNYIFLESTQAKATTTNPATFWNNTAPTSTVVSVGANSNTNVSGNDTILYCFAEVEGYSKFGSYTGNGSSDGPFVATSFAPAWILLKRTDTTGNWILLDNRRYGYNSSVSPRELYANLSNAEADSNAADFLSNGFKLRVTFGSYNASGGTYIFMALAENPFGGSGVSPATAR